MWGEWMAEFDVSVTLEEIEEYEKRKKDKQ